MASFDGNTSGAAQLVLAGTKSPRAGLWQSVAVVQELAPDLLVVVVPASDEDLPFLIADGELTVAGVRRDRAGKAALAESAAQRPLLGQLTRLLSARLAFSLASEDDLRVHCRSVFVDATRTAVTVVVAPMPGDSEVPKALRDAAITRVTCHRAGRAQVSARRALKELDDLTSRGPGAVDREVSSELERPAFDITPLLDLIPPGFAVRLPTSSAPAADRAITRAILAAPDPTHPPPRGGLYRALIMNTSASQRLAVVSWLPHRGLPPYGEVRAAAERRLPRAFVSPRQTGARPSFLPATGDLEVRDASPFNPAEPAWLAAFDDDAAFNFPQPQAAADRIRSLQTRFGFEAIAWYQPHHIHAENVWGVHVDAANLDDCVCSLSLDLQREGFGRGSDALAGKLGVGLVYQHMLFHAQFEAALTWMELQAGYAKYLPYQTQVCTAVRGTEGGLEEALANFWAWSWISADAMLAVITGALLGDQHAALERIVRATLDRSPVGHRRWRDGRQREVWRTLATQAVTGRPAMPTPGVGLPIKSILRDALPFDFRPIDVPLRVVGAGRVATRLR